ncbi:MAG: hypothetical protein IJE84_03545 [Clostridia bacterium]|nr:hypothetical protein [Clostridia bacterium]
MTFLGYTMKNYEADACGRWGGADVYCEHTEHTKGKQAEAVAVCVE